MSPPAPPHSTKRHSGRRWLVRYAVPFSPQVAAPGILSGTGAKDGGVDPVLALDTSPRALKEVLEAVAPSSCQPQPTMSYSDAGSCDGDDEGMNAFSTSRLGPLTQATAYRPTTSTPVWCACTASASSTTISPRSYACAYS